MQNLHNHPTAIIIIIGDEILSGRVQDLNTQYIAQGLVQKGIILTETRTIPDEEDVIINTIRELSPKADYIFTTGGIGPTHDDITSESIAQAFGKSLVQSEDSKIRLEAYFNSIGKKLTDASLKMTFIPEGAKLISNSISVAPGFIVNNVYVMAGIPNIMQVMFDSIMEDLTGGKEILSRTIELNVVEGEIATPLAELQKEYPEISIGSYPIKKDDGYCVHIVLRGVDSTILSILEQKVLLLSE